MGVGVLHVLHAFRPGGMENMVAQIAPRVSEMGISVALCALTNAGDFRSRLPVDVEIVELHKRPGLDWRCVLALRRLIDRLDPAVVHSHNWNGLVYSVAATVGTRRCVLHGEHAQLYDWEKSPLRLMLRSVLYSQCNLVHTVSQGQASELQKLGVSRRSELVVIPNGVDSERFSPQLKCAARERLGISLHGYCIGMVARCVPEKRHRLLLEAFESLAASHPDLLLVFAGSGGDCEESVKSCISSHPFSERIVWLGHRNDMHHIYNALDLMILPSIAEGMSNVCLEAMGCGVPVLVNTSCGADELVVHGTTGIVGRMNSPQDLVDEVDSLIDRPGLLREMGKAARAQIERYYRLEDTAAHYTSIYRAITGCMHQP